MLLIKFFLASNYMFGGR